MLGSIPLDGPVDLERLDDFLASDRAPPDCMQLSELDGFLTGVVIGPEMILPSVWLPMIWHDGEPAYQDLAEAQTILGIIMRRYNEIIGQVDSPSADYRPILVEQEDGSIDARDWALGFVEAMSLCPDQWETLASDDNAGVLIAPIMMLASLTDKADLPLDDDERLPDAEMKKLMANAPMVIGLCVSAVHQFFKQRSNPPVRRRTARKPKAKRR